MKLKDKPTREKVGGYDLLLRSLLGLVAIVILAMDMVEKETDRVFIVDLSVSSLY
jgi:hypothetical protein